MSDGQTVEEALTNLREAQESWLEVSLERGWDIPEPNEDDEYSVGEERQLSKGKKRMRRRQDSADEVDDDEEEDSSEEEDDDDEEEARKVDCIFDVNADFRLLRGLLV